MANPYGFLPAKYAKNRVTELTEPKRELTSERVSWFVEFAYAVEKKELRRAADAQERLQELGVAIKLSRDSHRHKAVQFDR